MAGALTIMILLMLSFVVVRVAAVAMRHTGLPEEVARLQCLSAFTGTGFTTGESEMIVNYPVRRRILSMLMILGNLGLVSIGATFIVSFVDAGQTSGALIGQVALFVVAGAVVLLVMTNKAVDRTMCDAIGAVLQRTTSLGDRPYKRTMQLADGVSLAEHPFQGGAETTLNELKDHAGPLILLGIRRGTDHSFVVAEADPLVLPGDILICSGRDDDHDAFAAHLADAG